MDECKNNYQNQDKPKTLLFCNPKSKKSIQKITENFVEAGLILKEERLRGLRGQEGLRDNLNALMVVSGSVVDRSKGGEDANVDFPNSLVYGRS